MSEFLLVTVAAAAVIVALLMFYIARSGRKTTIPGLDPSDPNDGNLGDVKNAGSLHEFLSEMHATYGPIVSFYWGKQITVSIASPELFKEHSNVFDRPVDLFALFAPLFTSHSIQYANGVDGRTRRKQYDVAFSHTAMIKYFATFEEVAKGTVDDLIAVPKDDAIPLMEYMLAFAAKSLTVVAFGDFFDDGNVAKLVKSYNMSWEEMERRVVGDIPPPGDPRHDTLATGRDNMFALMRQAMDHRRAHPGRPDEQQLIDVIMGSGKPEAVQFGDAVSFFIAGFHTTGILLTWCIYYLCTHPDVEVKLLQELNDVLKGKEVSPSNWTDLVMTLLKSTYFSIHKQYIQAIYTRDDLKCIVSTEEHDHTVITVDGSATRALGHLYMRQVLDETLRCSQLAPWAARFKSEDSKLGGHFIPAKTPVIHSLGVMSHDKTYWPNPEKFDPDRFQKKPANFSFVPFGFSGGRKCPAYQFAYIETTIALSILLPSVKFTLKEGQAIAKDYGLVTKPKAEILMYTERRL